MADAQSEQHVVQACRDHDVKFIRLWFTDILGILKSVAITVEELEHAFSDGISFDGASIEGFARVDEADMIAVPDPQTFQLLPWRPREQAVARMFCDINVPGGEPFAGDPRWVLKRALASAAERGYTFYVSPEIEFFYFHDAEGTQPLDRGGYFDLTPRDAGSDLRRETVLTLEEMGIPVALSHHEAAPSQHEIDLRYTDALTMADSIMTYRLVVKEVAMRHGVYATFMPKPVADQNGSGMHLQLSLFRGEHNAFARDNDEPSPPAPAPDGSASSDAAPSDAAPSGTNLSATAQRFMAGLLRHAPELMLLTNQWVNSYRRLIPGFEAPTHATWSARNQADLLRVPQHKPGVEVATRIEYRAPDPAANPYLVFAGLLAAGLAGVEGEYPLPPAFDRDPSLATREELVARGVQPLPVSLGEAIAAFEGSPLVRATLGDHVTESLTLNKRHEWDEYRGQVSGWELARYLDTL